LLFSRIRTKFYHCFRCFFSVVHRPSSSALVCRLSNTPQFPFSLSPKFSPFFYSAVIQCEKATKPIEYFRGILRLGSDDGLARLSRCQVSSVFYFYLSYFPLYFPNSQHIFVEHSVPVCLFVCACMHVCLCVFVCVCLYVEKKRLG
jgi:hypothetical protein